MEKLMELLSCMLTESLIQITISKARKSSDLRKVKIRPVMIKGSLYFQFTSTVGTKEIHKNYKKEEALGEIESLLNTIFGQIQLLSEEKELNALISKKGKVTVKCKDNKTPLIRSKSFEHNRAKRYILPIGEPIEFLVDLGIMQANGQIVKAKYDKFRQINRFLEFIEDVLPNLREDRELTIIDFGCGKSYLTFAMYYYLHHMKGYDIRVIGLDLKADVIQHCNELRSRYGFCKLDFFVGDIAEYRRSEPVDMVVTLHACDTATDYALYQAVRWKADVILSVPCCQHELNRQMSNEMLAPIFSYGIIKERTAALFTDAIRGKLLEEEGYDTQILEFIDMEHTPKNLLIRAVKIDRKVRRNDKLRECMDYLGVHPTLDGLLNVGGKK